MTVSPSILALSIAALLSPSIQAQDTLPVAVAKAEKQVTLENKQSLTAEQVDEQMITDINDTARYIPGVEVNNTGNRFADNGFNIRGMEGDAVAITVDGLSQGESLNPLTYSRYGMYSSTRNAVEIESVKTVEIVKGANSVLAGSGALGGAVMYTTKDASDFLPAVGDGFGGKFKIGYDGRNQETATTLSLANRSGNFETLAIYTLRDGNETQAHDDGADIVGAERGQADPFDSDKANLLLKLAYQFAPQHRLELVYEDMDNESTGTPLSRDSATYYDFHTDDESNRERVGLNYTWQANNKVFDELELKLNRQEIYTSGVTAFSYASGGSAYLRMEDRHFNQKLVNVTADFTKYVKDGDISHDLAYGLISQTGEVENHLQDIRYNGLDKDSGLREGYPEIDPSWVPKTDNDNWTVYFRDLIQLNEQFTVVVGLRYDNTRYSPETDDSFEDSANTVQDAEFSAVTGQLSASYEFATGHSLIASVGTGFKAPTTQQLYLNTNLNSQFSESVRVVDPDTGGVTYVPTGRTESDLDTVTNPDLEAEEGVNYELAYQWVGKEAQLKISAFRSDYKNMILNINHTNTFDTPITSATVNFRDPACQVTALPDSCWTVTEVSGDDYTVPTNSGKIQVTGFEIEGDWHLTQQLTATLAYSHSEGEYRNSPDLADNYVESSYQKGDPLESISPDSTVIGLNFHSVDQTWGASAMARFIEGKEEKPSFSATYYSNSASIVDLTAWYDVTDSLTLRASITNLFDEKYLLWQRVRNVREGSGGFFGGVAGDGIDRYSEPGRQFAANLSYSF
ncbi:TonB-dependent hemoglobin/transferrin/lactoferrin family receptor [Neptunicella sp. SCSIO 80796]|uniref:TonB-dependent hemoglobin/transferrin/lactoferrin family receptor n=1 Tax=Neptunicella plasticusilytica TaxID=3117012 RepID=UPI003A4D6504